MSDYDDRMNRAEEKLKPKLTDEFLQTLAEAVRVCGWTVDHTESTAFVAWCFELAGEEIPDLIANDYGKEET